MDPRACARDWLAGVNDACADLRAGRVGEPDWQLRMTALLARADVPALLGFLDFDALTARIDWPERGEASLRPALPADGRMPADRAFMLRVFALRAGRAIVPHGHVNMVSAFLVLAGRVRARTFDQVSAGPDWMVVKPRGDRVLAAGDHATMTGQDGNVHWFEAASDTAFVLDVNVTGVRPGPGARVFVDPAGERLPGGAVRARVIARDEAYRLYG